jgi:hypothetical protein
MKTEKGQAALEALAWLSISALMAVFSASAFARGAAEATAMKEKIELSDVLTELFGSMDSLGEGGERTILLRVPPGITGLNVSYDEFGEGTVSFQFRKAVYVRSVGYRTVFRQPNPLEDGGTKLVKIERIGGTVIVSGEVLDDD